MGIPPTPESVEDPGTSIAIREVTMPRQLLERLSWAGRRWPFGWSMMKFRLAAAMDLPAMLAGCCHLVACHPATYIAGTAKDAITDQPIADAIVSLYGYETRSAASGCFQLGGPDALPFEFGVSAPGYKPVVIKPAPGSYEATVRLAPVGTSVTSTVTTNKLSQETYAELSRSCP
ncbi:carboxypeptidase-like regulatory domain-containing protein [Xanthomonas sp. SS]|uniref:carboxypeptidase-like regulatory domain-containing protein n=1 Tax=Xanthomonas sp. SS TaxID=2724122 RepID=UPI001639D0BB|nr:carboxypeptidase-like regulatory domain-containing protein [Xanthomonas sp. SS]